MRNIFKQVMMPRVPRNLFDLSHDVKLSFDMGELIPIMTMETLPGDSFRIRPEMFLRLAPLVSPVMHNIIADMHFYFVPNRLLWDEWEDFITGKSVVTAPFCDGMDSVSIGEIGDYLGYKNDVPAAVSTLAASAMPIAAYLLIYDEYYRDENLQAEEFIPLVAGDNTSYDAELSNQPKKRAWQHDYFTSCLPFAQKGTSVTLPLLNNDEVDVVQSSTSTNPQLVTTVGGGSLLSGDVTSEATVAELQAGGTDAWLDPNGTLVVDINSEAVDIATLRRAFRLQEFLEKDARGGTRYIENVYSHFGVRSSDSRFHRPEYIGGLKSQVVISEVLSQTETLDSMDVTVNPVGQMAGHGISVGGGRTISYRCEEHGWIMGIVSVRPQTAYQQGIHKQFNRFTRLDYAFPEFAQIGEQPVTVKELYAGSAITSFDDLDTVFGYIPRYSEYKYMNSRVHGSFKTVLDYWHLGRKFSSIPVLNSNFIECLPDKRIFADQAEDGIFGHIVFNMTAIRPLPKFSTPTI